MDLTSNPNADKHRAQVATWEGVFTSNGSEGNLQRGQSSRPFEKGYSQMAWVRRMKNEDLSGLGAGGRPRNDITMDEVAKHASEEDGWTVLRGKVYRISPYLKYHPGGAAILKQVLGKDCTLMFNKYHAWVNAEFLLSKCLVGTLSSSKEKKI